MTIQEIKARLTIGRMLEHYQLEIKNGHVHCPFHDDKTPSMRVYEDTNTVYCFSANCPTHGHSLDVIELVQRQERCTKHQAILICKGMLGVVIPSPATRPIDQVWAVLQRSLVKHTKAKAYLKERGLSLNNVGYHSGQLAKSKLLEEVKLVGLINEQGKSWAKNCVIFPLRNATDQIVSFYGRSLLKGHYYQSGRCGLFPAYPSKSAKRIILTESVIDAASLLEVKALESYEVLALYGTNGFTGEHERALLACEQLEEVILMLDGDEAGQKASEKYLQQLSKLLPLATIRVVELPSGTDVNELWANHLNEGLFVELLKVAQPIQKTEVEEVATAPAGKLNTKNANNLVYEGLHAKYYVKGFQSKSLDSLKVTLIVELGANKWRGKVDLYEGTATHKYCRSASQQLGIKGEMLEADISLLTDELETYQARFEPAEGTATPKKPFEISASSRRQAKKFLEGKNLFSRLNQLMGETGIVGEENTRLLLLIVASSYKCDDPLHALIQGSSGTGKTLLMRKVMEMIPEPDRHIWTRISDKSLYHAGSKFKHSSVAVEDWDGLSEEVQFIIREMQSGKRLSSSITEKQNNGKLEQADILVEGPISTLMCTTRGAVYEDNMSRCLLVAVDESEEQTERILEYQYKKDRGEINSALEEAATQKLQNMVYVLEPKKVINPYAGKIQLPKRVHKIRRLNQLFQYFVKQITWLHQYQRKTDKLGRLITTKEDMELAIKLLFETIVLKVDELDGSLRFFFEALKVYVQEQEGAEKYCFSRLEVRQHLSISASQQHRYLHQLINLEYVERAPSPHSQKQLYRVTYWDDNKALRRRLQQDLTDQLNELKDL